MQRRRFIGLCVGAGFIAAGSAYYFSDDSSTGINSTSQHTAFEFLQDSDILIFTALVPIFVGEMTHDKSLLGEAQISRVIADIDGLMRTLPQRSRDEVRELLDLLTMDVSRLLAAGVWDNWENVSAQDKRRFLERWRDSWFALFQKAYHGLHQIILGSYYAQSASWKVLAYPGPPKFSS